MVHDPRFWPISLPSQMRKLRFYEVNGVACYHQDQDQNPSVLLPSSGSSIAPGCFTLVCWSGPEREDYKFNTASRKPQIPPLPPWLGYLARAQGTKKMIHILFCCPGGRQWGERALDSRYRVRDISFCFRLWHVCIFIDVSIVIPVMPTFPCLNFQVLPPSYLLSRAHFPMALWCCVTQEDKLLPGEPASQVRTMEDKRHQVTQKQLRLRP